MSFRSPGLPAGTRGVYGGDASTDHLMDVMRHGCGVTGLDAEDCWRRVRADVFRDLALPPISDVVFDVDVSTLDPDWVLPRIGNPGALGVWFPARNTRPVD